MEIKSVAAELIFTTEETKSYQKIKKKRFGKKNLIFVSTHVQPCIVMM